MTRYEVFPQGVPRVDTRPYGGVSEPAIEQAARAWAEADGTFDGASIIYVGAVGADEVFEVEVYNDEVYNDEVVVSPVPYPKHKYGAYIVAAWPTSRGAP